MKIIELTKKELTDMIYNVVVTTLAEYHTDGCGSFELQRAITDRCEIYNGLPVRIPLAYYPYGDTREQAERTNNIFVRDLTEAFTKSKLTWLRYNEDEYKFFMRVATLVFEREIRKILYNLSINKDIDIQLLAVPKNNENEHRECWHTTMSILQNNLNLTSHISSYVYDEEMEEFASLSKLPQGHFDKSFFMNDGKMPHVILLTDYVSKSNFNRVLETRKKLEEIGCTVLALIAISEEQ